MSRENKYFAKESEYAIKSIEKINYNDLSEEKIQEIITETNKSRKKFFDELNEKTDENGSAETTDSKTNYKKSTSIAKRFKEMLLISGIAKNEASAKSILSEMKNGKKPFEEDKARIYCFAAGLNTMETNDTLRKVFGFYGLYMRDYKDIIYSFFFRNNSEELCIDKFKEATELINEYKEKYESEKNKDAEHNTERKSTAYFEERVESAETIEDLKTILDIVVKNSGAKHRTATEKYCELVNEIIRESFFEMARAYDNYTASTAFATFTRKYAEIPYETEEFIDDSSKLYWESLRRLTDYLMPYNSFLISKKNDKKDEYSYLISCWKDNYNYSIECFEEHIIIEERGEIKKKSPVKDSSEFRELAEWISDNFEKDYDEVVNDLRKIFVKNTFITNFAVNKYDYKYFINKWKTSSRVLQSNSKARQHSEATKSERIGNYDVWFPENSYQIKNCDGCKHYEICDKCINCEDGNDVYKLCMHKTYCNRKKRENYDLYSTEDEKIISEGNKTAEARRCNQCKHHRKEKCQKCDICNRFNNKVYSADRDCINTATEILSLDYLGVSEIKSNIKYDNLMENYLTFKPTINKSYDLIFLLLSTFCQSTEKISIITDIELDMPDCLINNQGYLNRLKVCIDILKKESIDIKDCAKSRTILVFMKLIKEIRSCSVIEDNKLRFRTEQYSYVINTINKLLEECNMALLDPYNPFDLLIILALKTKAPFYVLYTALDLLNEQEN